MKLTEKTEEFVGKILRLTMEDQIRWDWDMHDTHFATYNGAIFQLKCDDLDPYLYVGQNDIRIGVEASRSLCRAIGGQWDRLRTKKLSDTLDNLNELIK